MFSKLVAHVLLDTGQPGAHSNPLGSQELMGLDHGHMLMVVAHEHMLKKRAHDQRRYLHKAAVC